MVLGGIAEENHRRSHPGDQTKDQERPLLALEFHDYTHCEIHPDKSEQHQHHDVDDYGRRGVMNCSKWWSNTRKLHGAYGISVDIS